MHLSAIVNRFIVKTELNSAITNDLQRKENFSKNLHSCRLSLFKLLTEHYLEFLSLTGGCSGSSESTLVKMPHCSKSHITAQLSLLIYRKRKRVFLLADFCYFVNILYVIFLW